MNIYFLHVPSHVFDFVTESVFENVRFQWVSILILYTRDSFYNKSINILNGLEFGYKYLMRVKCLVKYPSLMSLTTFTEQKKTNYCYDSFRFEAFFDESRTWTVRANEPHNILESRLRQPQEATHFTSSTS